MKINVMLLVDKIWMKDVLFYFILFYSFIIFYFYFSVSPPEGLPPYCGQGVCMPQFVFRSEGRGLTKCNPLLQVGVGHIDPFQ